jgi:hypothetical protein
MYGKSITRFAELHIPENMGKQIVAVWLFYEVESKKNDNAGLTFKSGWVIYSFSFRVSRQSVFTNTKILTLSVKAYMVSYEALLKKEQKIAVIGLGYVGLPLAVHMAVHFRVVGFDLDSKRIEDLKSGIDNKRYFFHGRPR